MKRLVAGFLLLPLGATAAQQHRDRLIADSSAAYIVAAAGPELQIIPLLVRVLRQENGTYPRTKLDAVADSLTSRALRYRTTNDSAAHVAAVNAVNALAFAGAARAFPGRPYDGAVERLIRIHQQSTAQNVRFHVVLMLPIVQGRQRALSYLRDIAASEDSTALSALNSLATDSRGGMSGTGTTSPAERQQSRAILLDLARNHLVKDRVAAYELELFLRSQPR